MTAVLRWLGIGLGVALAGLVLVGVAARSADGPLGPFPGEPLRADLVRLAQEKYGAGGPSDPDGLWFFRLAPRPGEQRRCPA